MGRVGWAGVALGAAVALLAGRSMVWALPDFYGIIAQEEGPGGAAVLSGEVQAAGDGVSALASAACWTFAYFLGGLAAGRRARLSPGLNGALSAGCGALFGALNFLAMVPGSLLSDPENVALLVFWAVAFAAFLPVAVLAAYLGGRVGGRLRARALGPGPAG